MMVMLMIGFVLTSFVKRSNPQGVGEGPSGTSPTPLVNPEQSLPSQWKVEIALITKSFLEKSSVVGAT
jgi:hypothetical protein